MKHTINPATTSCPGCGTQVRDQARFCSTCGQLLENIYRFATGQLPQESLLDNRYLVIQKIAQGGMGAIYKVADIRVGDRVLVLKEMSDSYLDPVDKQWAIEAFRVEAELLGKLSHPNIPIIYDAFSTDSRHYLVMEFVQGENLNTSLHRREGKPFFEEEVIAFALQLCDVLTYLHTLSPPIVFRDLKPDNIMLQPNGQIKLIDFGIARLFEPAKVQDTVILGTPGYAAPEQYGSRQTDARSDVYSLGVTLLQLTTGIDPSSYTFNFPPARSLSSGLSVKFEQVIKKATQPNPNNRFQTVQELCAALNSTEMLFPELASQSPSVGLTRWLNEKLRGKFKKERDASVKIGLRPVTLKLKKDLYDATKRVLEQKRLALVQNLADDFNKAEGKIIPLVGFPGVGTSYIANRTREYVLGQRGRNLDLVVQINFSSENSDEMLDTFLRRLRLEHGSLKRRLRKAINEAYEFHIEKVHPENRRKRSWFRSPPGKSGIRIDLPFVISFGEKFRIGGPVGIERFEETQELASEDNPPASPQIQRELTASLRDLIDILLVEQISIGFIFDKVTQPDALEGLYRILRNRGISTIVVLDIQDYQKWKQEGYPLAQNDEVYVPYMWDAGQILCQHMFGKVDESILPTLAMFAKYIDFVGQGRPKDFVNRLREFYTPPKRKSWFDHGTLVIEPKHLEAVGTYGRILNALEEDFDNLIPALYDHHSFRYDVARLYMYNRINWIIDQAKAATTFSAEEIVTSDPQVSDFNDLHTRVMQNLLEHWTQRGLVTIVDGQINTIDLIPNVATSHLLFCQNPICRTPLRPQANYCHKCRTEVEKS